MNIRRDIIETILHFHKKRLDKTFQVFDACPIKAMEAPNVFNLPSTILELSSEAYLRERQAEAAAYQYRGPSAIVVVIAHLASSARRFAGRVESWAQGPAAQPASPARGQHSLTR